MTKSFVEEIPVRVKEYVWENWGPPFIVGVMLLLMVAAASLSMGLGFFADEVTVYAYYALVAGVVMQLFCFLENTEGNGEKD